MWCGCGVGVVWVKSSVFDVGTNLPQIGHELFTPGGRNQHMLGVSARLLAPPMGRRSAAKAASVCRNIRSTSSLNLWPSSC